MLERYFVEISLAGRAVVAVAVAQFQRALVVGQRESAFFGEHHALAAFVVHFAQKQVFHNARIGIEGFDEIHPVVAFAQITEYTGFYQRKLLFLLENFGKLTAAQFRPR